MNYPIAINYALESSIVNYLQTLNTVSGSLLSGSNLNYYTGIGNEDLAEVPAVVVDAADATETDLQTLNYTFQVKVLVKEAAADTTNLGQYAQAVFNEFQNSYSSSANFTNANYGIGIWRVLRPRVSKEVVGDFLYNMIETTMYGALIPSGSAF